MTTRKLFLWKSSIPFFFVGLVFLLFLPRTSNKPLFTEVGGPIYTNTTWSLVNSPYIVVETVEVSQNVTLTIEPGVVVKFDDGRRLLVDGTLAARGTSNNSILFTSIQAAQTRGYWGNIEFSDTATPSVFDENGNYISGSILQYCVVEYAGKNVYGAIRAHSLMVDNCLVQYNAARAVEIHASTSTPGRISNSTIYSNAGDIGVYVLESEAVGNIIIDNESQNFGAGIMADVSMVTQNLIARNVAQEQGGGILAQLSTVMSNTIIGNYAQKGGGIYANNSTVNSNAVYNNIAEEQGGGIYVLQGGHVSGNIVYGNSVTGPSPSGGTGGGIYSENSTILNNQVIGNDSIYQGGGIFAKFSTVSSNTLTANSAVLGGGVYADASIVSSNTIANNEVIGYSSDGAGAYIYGNEDFSFNVVVGNNPGGLVLYGNPQVHFNTLYGNQTHNVVVLGSSDISGTNNYWGTSNTLDIAKGIYDWYDDGSRGKFVFYPYLLNYPSPAVIPPPLHFTATVSGADLILSWDALPVSTTDWAYKIYYDYDDPLPPYTGVGLEAGPSPISVSGQTSYTLSGFNSNKTYYISVTASDSDGHESWYSNQIVRPRQFLVFLPVLQKNG